ncbi:tetratricopeptide repeat protein [Anaerolentibacter hominis]|uniref:tetratricopeptide repeat protein n=1 Tax=Anaerolentibacter hominis TaxID=3079009 RepID=UPI0031B808E7
MNCPRCSSPLAAGQNRCVHCGMDVSIYRRIINNSIAFYNDGVARARVRDLSGAVIALKRSLEFDKNNIMARNLLGLIYFEMDEIAQALSQWIISKNIQEEDNLADEYIREIQASPAYLNEVNQYCKKYNTALNYARSGSDDLAIIQLRKIHASNPKFIRSGQLLALLFIKTGELEKAKKVLKKLLKVDVNNTTVLYYISQIREMEQLDTDRKNQKDPTENMDNVQSVGRYREDRKPSVFLYLNLLIGIAIGLAVCWILVVPTIKKAATKESNSTITTLGEEIALLNAEAQNFENEKQELQDDITKLEEELEAYKKDEKETASAAESMEAMLEAVQMYMEGKSKTDVVKKLAETDADKITNETAKNLYNYMKDNLLEQAVAELFAYGRDRQYNMGNFSAASETFSQILDLQPDHVDAMFYLARSYQRMGENEKAKNYFEKIIADYPESTRVAEAQRWLNQIPQ